MDNYCGARSYQAEMRSILVARKQRNPMSLRRSDRRILQEKEKARAIKLDHISIKIEHCGVTAVTMSNEATVEVVDIRPKNNRITLPYSSKYPPQRGPIIPDCNGIKIWYLVESICKSCMYASIDQLCRGKIERKTAERKKRG